MSHEIETSATGLQAELLGRQLDELLTESVVAEDLETASRFVAAPLQSLLRHSGAMTADDALCLMHLKEQAQRWRSLVLGESTLTRWQGDGACECRDFVALVAFLRGLESDHGPVGPLQRLEHMLALGAVRLKLEPQWGAEVARSQRLFLSNPGYLNAREIAAVCQLREGTVKNAMSRRELTVIPGRGVPVARGLDWMVQRRGFLYPALNAASRERRINGRIVDQVLCGDVRVARVRYISRLRLSEWRLRQREYRFAINAEGVHHCQIMLPGIDGEGLTSMGVLDLAERSGDTQARLYRESLRAEEGVALWQGTIPTMQVLDDVLNYLLSMPDGKTEAGASRNAAGPQDLGARHFSDNG
ncbi:hypothetical protein [Aidingimonas lacisalsi]|uniref:hypothetical protein n=1 Tax=Aidingimonas lacisalsi TaxID=2604086 RepID=UPI0011D28CC4|nr:hypothetical protein [Aidingimonas lacisalsi]